MTDADAVYHIRSTFIISIVKIIKEKKKDNCEMFLFFFILVQLFYKIRIIITKMRSTL
jgi:hypothetical protein